MSTFCRPSVAGCSMFHICGATGLCLGTTLAMVLAGQTGLSRGIVAMLLAMGVVMFLTLAMATKIVTGREALVYYHHEVAILASSAALLRAFGSPVLAYLDVTALGLGVFLACGRVGCLMVGCCHGRPHHWGVQYSQAHADEGFPHCYVGVRLFPVQAIEALFVAAVVVAGAMIVLAGQPPGTALSWYVVSYSAARIGIEELRGDRVRPYWRRLSEAQWTSLLLILLVVLGEWQGRLPFSIWHVVICAGATVSLVLLAWNRTEAGAIVHPRHACEIATIVKALSPGTASGVAVQRTSLTVGVSTQTLGDTGAILYSLSRSARQLTLPEARALARLIVNVACPSARQPRLVRGNFDVFHVIVQDTRRSP